MICCWVENPNSDVLKRHLPRLHDYLWIAEDGMKTKVFFSDLSHYCVSKRKMLLIVVKRAIEVAFLCD